MIANTRRASVDCTAQCFSGASWSFKASLLVLPPRVPYNKSSSRRAAARRATVPLVTGATTTRRDVHVFTGAVGPRCCDGGECRTFSKGFHRRLCTWFTMDLSSLSYVLLCAVWRRAKRLARHPRVQPARAKHHAPWPLYEVSQRSLY